MPFNPSQHLTDIKGKQYLEVKWRLVWFREDHPDWAIHTEIVKADEKGAVMKASILNAEGKILAQATKSETPGGFADYIEKAETGAIGRALALCGYGTQFAPELEEGQRIVDSPVGEIQVDDPQPTYEERVKVFKKPSETSDAVSCDECGQEMKLIPAGVSKKTGKDYDAFYSCNKRTGGCGRTQPGVPF